MSLEQPKIMASSDNYDALFQARMLGTACCVRGSCVTSTNFDNTAALTVL